MDERLRGNSIRLYEEVIRLDEAKLEEIKKRIELSEQSAKSISASLEASRARLAQLKSMG